MQNLPHHYSVSATCSGDGNVELASPGLSTIESAPPAEFGGPGDRWSPESLLTAAVADCFILSFKAIARASNFDWLSLGCDVEGILDRQDRITRFTEFHLRAELVCPQGTNEEKARRLLDKAEGICLITNSLTSATHLRSDIRISGA